MGFAFPKWERQALVASEPHKFQMPEKADLRYHWLVVRLDAIDDQEMREIVLEAGRMAGPKRVAAAPRGDGAPGRSVRNPGAEPPRLEVERRGGSNGPATRMVVRRNDPGE